MSSGFHRPLHEHEHVLKDFSLAEAVHDTAASTHDIEVLCTVSFQEDIDSTGLTQLCQWITELEGTFGLKVECAYKSTSSVLVCKLPYHLWSRLDGLPGFKFIAYVQGNDIAEIIHKR